MPPDGQRSGGEELRDRSQEQVYASHEQDHERASIERPLGEPSLAPQAAQLAEERGHRQRERDPDQTDAELSERGQEAGPDDRHRENASAIANAKSRLRSPIAVR